MKFRLCLGATALLLSVHVGAAQLSAQGTAELDRYLQDAVATSHIPGMVALVVDRNGVVYEKAFGLMDKANKKPMSTDAIFRLASMTKAITSTSIMMLVEEGKVDLDAPASKYLPALANPKVIHFLECGGRHLWFGASEERHDGAAPAHAHIGPGLRLHQRDHEQADERNFGVRATSFPLMFEPGTQWLYGESTAVLGEIVEAVSGKEQFVFMQERLLGPLRMTDTTFDVAAEKNARVVTVHQRNGTTMTETPNPPGVISAPHRGDGGLSATARDYSKFIQMFLNDGRGPGGARLLKPATVKLMGQNHTAPVKVPLMHSTTKFLSEDFPVGAGVDSYALGFQRTEAQVPGMRSVGSLAWAGIYNTEFWIDKEKGIGAVLLMQYLPFYDAKAIEVLQGFERRVYNGLGK